MKNFKFNKCWMALVVVKDELVHQVVATTDSEFELLGNGYFVVADLHGRDIISKKSSASCHVPVATGLEDGVYIYAENHYFQLGIVVDSIEKVERFVKVRKNMELKAVDNSGNYFVAEKVPCYRD